MTPAHRVAALLSGKITDLRATRDTLVLHTCHNRKCVNPHHLYIGTHKDNARDMINAGHTNWQYGEDNTSAVYSDSQIDQVFTLRKQGLSQKEIAQKTKISCRYVSDILCGRARKHQFIDTPSQPVRPTRHKSKHPDWIKAAILDLYTQGRGCSEIARELDVKKSFVFSFVKRELGS